MYVRAVAFAFLGLMFAVGCAEPTERPTLDSVAHGPAATLTTDQGAYTPGEAVTVSWTALPGNSTDWIAIAPAGSASTVVSAWAYTASQVSGSHTFADALAAGDYVARAFVTDTYDLIIESSTFTVQASTGNVSSGSASYDVTQPITVTWSGLAGTASEWIAIAPAGSELTQVTTYTYTGGTASGTHAFAGLSTAGSYVVRAFAGDGYTLLDESDVFAVTSSMATITTDQVAYAAGASVVVTWSGLPGNATDWIGLAPQGSSPTTVSRWVYTGGASSGSATLEAPADGGGLVARAFPNDSYVVVGQSAVFTVGTEIATSATSYALNAPITVTWDDLPGNPNDWIAIAPAGSSPQTITAWTYASGSSGTHTFNGIGAAGTYVARAFLDNSYTIVAESAEFTVGGAGAGATVTTDAATYAAGQAITVTWTDLPGNASDWIAIAPEGSPDTTTTVWVYTGGATSGSTTFASGVTTAGTYVARAFLNDTYTRLAESTAFVVQ